MKNKPTEKVYIGLGSNKGDRSKNIARAIEELKKHKNIRVKKISSFYLTEPEGEKLTHPFINCVIELSTSLSPSQLLKTLEAIEKRMGRANKGTQEDRIIDLDILFMGKRRINTEKLTIPHKKAHLRRFVLVPLTEIAPNFIHPAFGKSISALLKKLTDDSVIIKLRRYK